AGQSLGFAQTFEDAPELTQGLQRVAQIEPQIDGALVALAALRQPAERFQGAVEADRRLLVRAARVRLRAGLVEILVRLLPQLALEGVMGESLHVIGEPPGIQTLDRLRDARVQGPPRLGEEP